MVQEKSNTPKFRWKITTKFNLLSISLILITSIGIAGYILHRDVSNNYGDLLAHGRSIAEIVAQNSEYGIYTEDQDYLAVLLECTLRRLHRLRGCVQRRKQDDYLEKR